MRNGFENITNKMRAEQDRFIDDMMKKSPKDIISAAYGRGVRDDILRMKIYRIIMLRHF